MMDPREAIEAFRRLEVKKLLPGYAWDSDVVSLGLIAALESVILAEDPSEDGELPLSGVGYIVPAGYAVDFLSHSHAYWVERAAEVASEELVDALYNYEYMFSTILRENKGRLSVASGAGNLSGAFMWATGCARYCSGSFMQMATLPTRQQIGYFVDRSYEAGFSVLMATVELDTVFGSDFEHIEKKEFDDKSVRAFFSRSAMRIVLEVSKKKDTEQCRCLEGFEPCCGSGK